MTPQEHAERILRTMRKVERAQRAHHEAVSAAVREHGQAFGLDSGIIAAAAPKNPPDNPSEF
jgi:hypothetical protein